MAAAPKGRARKPTAKAGGIVTDPNDPLSWLYLNPGRNRTDLQFGVLRRTYGDRVNTAAEFGRRKLRPIKEGADDSWQITAERHDVVLPVGAGDRLSDPRTLFEAMDDAAVQTGLLTYVTLSFPTMSRLHHAWESARRFAVTLAVKRCLASVVILHAPGRVASPNPIHAHLLIAPRQFNQMGDMSLGAYDPVLTTDLGQRVIEAMWEAHIG